jgi:signal transduction histidine kinase
VTPFRLQRRSPCSLPLYSCFFDRFYRARTATTHNVGGTGLGLAIAKAIADAHDAQLHVTSELGRGTMFQLRLPTLAPAGPDSQPSRSLAALRP